LLVLARRRPFVLPALALVLLAAGCGNQQDTLRPASKPAHEIATLWWDMMIGAWAGLGVVVLLLVLAWVRRKRTGDDRKAMRVIVAGGIVVPILVLATLFVVADIVVIGDTQAPAATSTKMTIEVIGHQWWWEVRYPGTRAVTANEIHIPVRTAVNLKTTTADVIHSFWVPELNRKVDAIPDHVNRILLYADRVGRYRGQCAEFCGLQHAHMSMIVFAQPRAQFERWLARQSKPAAAPTSTLARRGLRAFLEGPCQSCHTIRGTSASGFVGPDLTHVATRTTLGAVTIPNRRHDLAEWIVDSQHVKPGNQMPDVDLRGARLQALVTYLESLR
jgi:cytochrome c oxidase subunit 2